MAAIDTAGGESRMTHGTQEETAQATPGPYTAKLDILTALITQLAINPHWSRTLKFLSDDLSLPQEEVREALGVFGSLFRENNGYYSLHARAALRNEDEAPELRADILKVLLEYVLKRSDTEASQAQFRETLKQTRHSANRAAVLALIAAIASVVAAILAAVLGH
jgi:hypothetical protein